MVDPPASTARAAGSGGDDAAGLLAATEAFVTDVVLPHVAQWDRDDELPAEAGEALTALNLTGALVGVEHGGPGRTVAELVPVWRALSRGWISLTGAVNLSGLAVTLLQRHGSPEQQARWLPALGSGAIHASFSITEPQAGSDLARLETTARVLPGDGRDDGRSRGDAPSRGPRGLELSGTKRWVAGGVSSDVVFMLVLVEGAEKPSCVVLPTAGRGSQSWRVEEIDKVGYRGVESAAYRFDAHHEPGAELLGGPDGLGRGAPQMLDALDVGRVNVACRALGILDRCLAVAVGECVGREIGDGVLGDHTHAQLRVGELRARTLAAAVLTEQAARAVDAGDPGSRDLATAAKVIASDATVWAIDQVARLAASRSYGADDELARLRRDAPQTQIGEGANDALLMALAREPLDAAAHDAP